MDNIDIKHAQWIVERTKQQLQDARLALRLIQVGKDLSTASSLLERTARKASEVARNAEHLAGETEREVVSA